MQTAKGVADVPPEDKLLKNKIVQKLTQTFELFGFMPLETPTLERYETLAAKGGAGEESDALKETFKLTDQGDRKLALRFDLTVPLARYVAMNPALKMPFKRYEIGRVYRDGPIKLGRMREFWQCDVDIVGVSSMLADAEIIAIEQAGFQRLGLDVVIKVNNRKLLSGILAQCGIEKKEQAIIALDKLDKIGKQGVTKELQERGYTEQQIKSLFGIIKEGISLSEIRRMVKNEEGNAGIAELEELFSYFKKNTVVFEVTLARGLGYYTGTVFEVFLKSGKIGSSLGSGGRYDTMIGKFMGSDKITPAVGGSFGLVPIMEALRLEGNAATTLTTAKVLLVSIGTEKESLNIAAELRAKGIPTSFAMGKKGISKNLEYASALGIPYVLLVGENELKQKKVTLRNMQDGTQQLLSLKDVVTLLQ